MCPSWRYGICARLGLSFVLRHHSSVCLTNQLPPADAVDCCLRPYPAGCKLPEPLLAKMRAEFEFWYPFDLRVSGEQYYWGGGHTYTIHALTTRVALPSRTPADGSCCKYWLQPSAAPQLSPCKRFFCVIFACMQCGTVCACGCIDLPMGSCGT